MDAVQVFLETAHVGREVLHLGVYSVGKVLDQAIEVLHFELNAFEALSEYEAQVCLMLWNLHLLLILLYHELLSHLLEAFFRASDRRCRS